MYEGNGWNSIRPRSTLAFSRQASLPRSEYAVENHFLGLPDQRHGDGEWSQAENQLQGHPDVLEPEQGLEAEMRGQVKNLRQRNHYRRKNHPADDQPAVERCEVTGLLAQGFIRQHGSKLP